MLAERDGEREREREREREARKVNDQTFVKGMIKV